LLIKAEFKIISVPP